MDIIYRAFDGTEFDSKIVCQHYEEEKQNKAMNDSIIGMTSDGKITRYIDCNFLDNTYIYIKNNDGINAIIERCRNEGVPYDGFDQPGIYFWNDIDIPELESDTWQPVDLAITTLNNIINEMIAIENKLSSQLN